MLCTSSVCNIATYFCFHSCFSPFFLGFSPYNFMLCWINMSETCEESCVVLLMFCCSKINQYFPSFFCFYMFYNSLQRQNDSCLHMQLKITRCVWLTAMQSDLESILLFFQQIYKVSFCHISFFFQIIYKGF